MLKRNCTEVGRRPLKQRSIVVTDFNMGIGSEVIHTRSAIVLSSHSHGDDTLVVPLTSAQLEKQTDPYDVFISKDPSNALYQNSYARVRQLRAVSLNRI